MWRQEGRRDRKREERQKQRKEERVREAKICDIIKKSLENLF